MKNIVIAVILSAGGAFAAAGFYFAVDDEVPGTNASTDTNTFDATQPVEARIANLEKAVSEERLARQLLQEEVLYLTMELERSTGQLVPPGDEAPQVVADESASRNARREEYRRRNSREGRVESLVAAGFLPSQADMILRREEELQMQAIQDRFDAERSGESVDWMANRTLASDTLREELGDADYERYLEANNRSTRIAVSSVIESSPAQTAGLQPGDEIVRYDGERVFSMTDLSRQTMVGAPGETVVVDVMRNGNIMQVVMPRGPVGITGGRRRF